MFPLIVVWILTLCHPAYWEDSHFYNAQLIWLQSGFHNFVLTAVTGIIIIGSTLNYLIPGLIRFQNRDVRTPPGALLERRFMGVGRIAITPSQVARASAVDVALGAITVSWLNTGLYNLFNSPGIVPLEGFLMTYGKLTVLNIDLVDMVFDERRWGFQGVPESGYLSAIAIFYFTTVLIGGAFRLYNTRKQYSPR